jgi:hypothetical protein
MTFFQKTCFLPLLLVLSCADFAAAMTVFLKDDSEIEAQSAWREGEKVFVRVNSELCLDFPAGEVNLGATKLSRPPRESLTVAGGNAAASRSAGSTGVLDELIRVAGHRREFNDTFGRNTHTAVDEIFSRSFTPALAEETFKRSLQHRLSQREMATVLAWYKTPAGRKIVEANSVFDFNRREKSLTYARTESVPGLKERLSLISQIEKAIGASEQETKLVKSILLKMEECIPADFPDAKDVKKRLRAEIPVQETKRKEQIEQWAYAYRYLSLQELRNYLEFLRSPTGRRYMDAVRVGNEELFRKVALNIEREFRKDVKNLM